MAGYLGRVSQLATRNRLDRRANALERIYPLNQFDDVQGPETCLARSIAPRRSSGEVLVRGRRITCSQTFHSYSADQSGRSGRSVAGGVARSFRRSGSFGKG